MSIWSGVRAISMNYYAIDSGEYDFLNLLCSFMKIGGALLNSQWHEHKLKYTTFSLSSASFFDRKTFCNVKLTF